MAQRFSLENKDLICKTLDRENNHSMPIQVKLEDNSSVQPIQTLQIDQLPLIQLKTLPVLQISKEGTHAFATFYQTKENNPALSCMKGENLSLASKQEVEHWGKSNFVIAMAPNIMGPFGLKS